MPNQLNERTAPLREQKQRAPITTRGGGRGLTRVALALLAVEFLDELVGGSFQAALPLIRGDLALTYAEVGLLLGVPRVVGNLIEPPLGVLADVWNRRALIVGGGALFALALLVVATGQSFAALLLAFVVFSPAGGAFVGFSQAALMDAAPARREQNMARWSLAGSLGIVSGSLVVGALIASGVGWRTWYAVLALLAALLVLAVARLPLTTPAAATDEQSTFAAWRDGARDALRALSRRGVVRWLALLEIADLMLDGFHGFIALYFVDVVGVTEGRAALAVTVWSGVGLAGDFLLIPLLERVRGLRYLRWSALATLALYPVFLSAPGLTAKLVLLALLGIGNAGWYSILKAQLYAALPHRSGTALALHSLAGVAGGALPLALGLFAGRFGLAAMMWLLVIAPVALLVTLPRGTKDRAPC